MWFNLRRREFIALLGGSAACPFVAHAQQPRKLPTVGFLSSRSPEESEYLLEAFRQGLKEGGFVEGQNVAIESRWARGQYDRLPALAAELVSRGVTVLDAIAGEPVPLAAMRATSTIPIVFMIGTDPVERGLVKSFNRPGGNVTGVTILTNMMEPKRLGLLHELAPGADLIGVLMNPNFPEAVRQLPYLKEAARTIGRRLVIANASHDEELDAAFELVVQEHVGALLVGADPYFNTRRDRIVAFAAKQRLPRDLSVSRICRCRRIAELWNKPHRRLPPVRRLHRESSQGRKARRAAGSTADQVRVRDQPQDR
jgi:putative tryptophan/tyrosine transport system substrate-binding protein